MFVYGILAAVYVGGVVFWIKECWPYRSRWHRDAIIEMSVIPVWPVAWPVARLFWVVKRRIEKRRRTRK